MTTAQMLDLIYQRTKIADKTKCLRELQTAFDWAVVEIFKDANGPQLLYTVGEELPAVIAVTRDYDLGANLITGNMLGLQTLWVKLPSGTLFTPLSSREVASQDFRLVDSATAANPAVASGFPIYFAVIDSTKIRFAPALPIGSVIRADYARFGAAPDPVTNNTATAGADLNSIFHSAICFKATALLFNTLDDTREIMNHQLAISTLNSAIYAAGKATRTQQPIETKPFRRGTRRRGL